jgi:hypothetical protein
MSDIYRYYFWFLVLMPGKATVDGIRYHRSAVLNLFAMYIPFFSESLILSSDYM